MEATETTVRVHDIDVHHEVTGDGDPLVLVHGSWSDHTTWRGIVPGLAASHRVVAYDRRGHSRTPAGADRSRAAHERDLAALIEALDLGAVHLVGSSYGALISLGLAAQRPDLVRSVVGHEPPAIGSSADPLGLMARFQSFADDIRAGDAAGAARRFIERVLGTGMWARLPDGLREAIVGNAPTYLDMLDDPHCLELDVAALRDRTFPILLTDGTETPSWLRSIVPTLAGDVGGAERHTFEGGGHMPHGTHPDELVDVVTAFTAGC